MTSGRVLGPAQADALAAAAHRGDRHKTGMLLIEHVRRVAERMSADPDPHAVPAALLHDIVESGALGWDDLRTFGADERLVAVVDALTERPGESSVEYLCRCAADPLALRIKRVDIEDKFDLPDELALSAEQRRAIGDAARDRLALLERLAGDQRSVGSPGATGQV